MERRRVPDRVFGAGEEPDPRFSLANERTFLSWIRTALALMAAGVAIEAVELDVEPHLRLASAVVLVLAGISSSLLAWFGWAGSERAMRAGEPLPSSAFKPALAVAVALAGVLLGLGALVS
ncbi:YidH family protein [Luteipulveratus flavus]|uniref:DUF202 domain-containing protein n=1 Tax=Luteipulveratus flavus TaxID=3031728 RepID=A0ABT6C8J5_9MICO|nr:DUF202 domain-containing protein [Luteipulveratus sp. YIM 133296]MDF8265200.1 DUF202 domain-containing protein [Luteipulveratus sp. YIM 133296]